MAIPRPEHPRPQFVRNTWINLNGEWDFLFDFSNSGEYRELWKSDEFMKGDTKKINVPFCPEGFVKILKLLECMRKSQ